MIDVILDIQGLDKTVEFLEALRKAIEEPQTPLESVGEYLLNFFSNDLFMTEGAAYGNRWEDLSEPYRTKKAEEYPGAGILVRTGEMMRGFKALPVTDVLTIYNDTEYAKYHQEGTSKMPQRILLQVDDERSKQISSIFMDHLFDSMKGL